MKAKVRISREERRKLILLRVRELFAHNGFHGVTTRELAEAAGISEGLLFKMFPDARANSQLPGIRDDICQTD